MELLSTMTDDAGYCSLVASSILFERLDVVRDEYRTNMENSLQATQLIEHKADGSRSSGYHQQNFNRLKQPAEHMQLHRLSLDRLRLLSSTLPPELTDIHDDAQVRQRLNRIT